MDDLLTCLSSSRPVPMPELAAKLHMSEAMICARLERYEQLGYVRKVIDRSAGGCSGSCGSCKGCGSHKVSVRPSVYWIVRKGVS